MGMGDLNVEVGKKKNIHEQKKKNESDLTQKKKVKIIFLALCPLFLLSLLLLLLLQLFVLFLLFLLRFLFFSPS
jgi:hypothetical protein